MTARQVRLLRNMKNTPRYGTTHDLTSKNLIFKEMVGGTGPIPTSSKP